MNKKMNIEFKVNVDTESLKTVKRHKIIKMYVENTEKMFLSFGKIDALKKENEFYRKIIERLL